MGDAGEGLIDQDSRIQERMEELAREKMMQSRSKDTRDPEQVRAIESLRLARKELESQLGVTTHDRRRTQLKQAIEEVDRRLSALA
jgi:hypothetical protein